MGETMGRILRAWKSFAKSIGIRSYKRAASRPRTGRLDFRNGRVIGLEQLESRNLLAVGSWTALASAAPFNSGGGMVLLSDGTVMAKSQSGGSDGYGNTYYKLTPSSTGSYINGTWTALTPMNDTRLYYSTQVLTNGNVYVAGGEYGSGKAKGEVYNPLTNAWTATGALPSGDAFSDANSEILPNGNVLQALVSGSLTGTLIYNPTTNTYSTGPSANGITNESMWVKLPDNSILFVNRASTSSERYIPASNSWVNDANVPVSLYDSTGDESGAGFLLPNGNAFFLGATGSTAIYTPSGSSSPGSWVAGPNIPNSQATPDAPAAMMVNGNILCAVSPKGTSSNEFPSPTTFYEYNYVTNSFTQTGVQAAVRRSTRQVLRRRCSICPMARCFTTSKARRISTFIRPAVRRSPPGSRPLVPSPRTRTILISLPERSSMASPKAPRMATTGRWSPTIPSSS